MNGEKCGGSVLGDGGVKKCGGVVGKCVGMRGK